MAGAAMTVTGRKRRRRAATPHPAPNVRAAIKAEAVLDRLQDYALGVADMTSTQVRAAEVALKQAEPADERSGEGDAVRKIISAEPISDEQWERQYGGAP
jgi:hypothetical protein